MAGLHFQGSQRRRRPLAAFPAGGSRSAPGGVALLANGINHSRRSAPCRMTLLEPLNLSKPMGHGTRCALPAHHSTQSWPLSCSALTNAVICAHLRPAMARSNRGGQHESAVTGQRAMAPCPALPLAPDFIRPPVQQSCDSLLQYRSVRGLAFPHHVDPPSTVQESCFVLMIPGDVVGKLFLPELDARLGRVGKTASGVPMPEAAVDEDHRTATLHYDVRSPGQTGDVEPIADPVHAQGATDDKLGPGIPAADRCHHRRVRLH